MIQQFGLAARGLLFMAFLLLANCGGDSGSDLTPGETNISPLALASLTLDNGSLSPDFESSRLGLYTINVENSVSSINFVATLSDEALADNATIRSFKRGASDEDELALLENIPSGSSFSREIDEGDNSFYISVVRSDGKQVANYELMIHRVGITSELSSVLYSDPLEGDYGFEDDFASDVLDYTYTAAYETCRIGVAPFVAIEGSTVAVQTGTPTDPFEGESTEHLAETFINLPLDGSGVISFEVTPEEGDLKSVYTFTYTRESTDEEIAADATLFDLNISTGELDFAYSCLDLSYEARVDRDIPSTDLTLTPSVPGASMTITHVVASDETAKFDDDTPINADEAFTLDLDIGDNSYIITVTSSDETTTTSYSFVVTRSDTNWKYVASVEELQNAMLTAIDYDEIVLEAGEYFTADYLSTSGATDAFLYAGISAENKIVLRGDGETILDGGDVDANTMLKVSAENWVIQNLFLTNVRNGLVLDGASNNVLSSMNIYDVGERGAHIYNGSSNNKLIGTFINTTGQSMRDGLSEYMGEAIVVGSDDADWSTAPTPGNYNEADLNNEISNFIFGSGIPTEIIDIKEGTTGTVLEYNTFSSAGITENAENSSVVVIKGNDTEVRYNTFYHINGEDLGRVISMANASESWHTTTWGSNAKIFDNIFSLNDEEIVAVTAEGETSAYVDDNVRDDDLYISYLGENDLDISYLGDGISSVFTSPTYKIQSFLDSSLCLAEGSADFDDDYATEDSTDVNNYDLLLLVNCDDAPAWELSNEGDSIIQIGDLDSGQYLSPNTSSFASQLNFLNVNETFSTTSDLYEWQVSMTADGVVLINGFTDDGSFAISSSKENNTVDDGFVDGDVGVYMGFYSGSSAQTFLLIEQ